MISTIFSMILILVFLLHGIPLSNMPSVRHAYTIRYNYFLLLVLKIVPSFAPGNPG